MQSTNHESQSIRTDSRNQRTASSLFSLPKTFMGCWPLKAGVVCIGVTDIFFGFLMAASYFREPAEVNCCTILEYCSSPTGIASDSIDLSWHDSCSIRNMVFCWFVLLYLSGNSPNFFSFSAMSLNHTVMLNIYLLLVLFNNCLVLSICIAFLIIGELILI